MAGLQNFLLFATGENTKLMLSSSAQVHTMARRWATGPISRPAAELPFDLVAEIARAAGGKSARAMRLTCKRWRIGVAQGVRALQVGCPRCQIVLQPRCHAHG